MNESEKLPPGDLELAAMLYRLRFPTRDFYALPEHVQLAYRSDAERLREMIRST